ncbi:MAG: GatB/YqeY domain-containing protein [Actinobacteria bacterium]|nr:GatB/YqeY domain-containing protein [Actinomycetota bacterium]
MTNLKEQLHTDLTAAIKAKDSLTSGTLRMVLAAITNEEVSGKEARVLNDQDMITVLNREAKKRKEAATAYDDAKRLELADKERAELGIIQAYLPAALSDEDLAKIIAEAVAEVAASGATGPSAMGAVMKIVSPQVSGRADGGAVAAAVKSALA